MAISADLRALLQPPSSFTAQQAVTKQLNSSLRDIRTNDLVSYFLAASTEHENLQAELTTSQTSLNATLQQARTSLLAIQKETETLHAHHLQLEDELIDHRLQLVSAVNAPVASTSKTVLEELEGLHERVGELQNAAAYFAVLEIAEDHSLKACAAIRDGDLEAALTSYSTLAEYSQSLAQQAKRGELVQAAAFVKSMLAETFEQLKNALSEKLSTALDNIGWPTDLNVSQYDSRLSTSRAFETAFVDLLRLQRSGEQTSSLPPSSICLPLEALLAPLSLRFRYHFEGKRSTNRLDKPEWYFAHILNLVSSHTPFIASIIQPLLNKHGYRNIDAEQEFISLLLTLVERKLKHTVPQLLHLPPIFAHTIFQALQFDAALIEQYGYVGKEGEEWKGTADVILGNDEWFEGWKEAERKYSEDKYYEIIGSSDAWQINEDHTESTGIKPTNSALRVKDLIESVTDRYKPLPLFSYRLAFLIAVQIPLIEAYHLRISSAVDAFETLNIGMLRAVPGALGEGANGRLTAGVGGVQRLVKAGISAKWFGNACRTWGDDVFFLDLWQDIKELSLDGLDVDTRAAAEKLLADAKSSESTLFDGFADAFAKLSTRTDEILTKHIIKEVIAELKSYIAKRWDFETEKSTPEGSQQDSLSPDITAALTLYQALLSALSATLPPVQLQAIFRNVSNAISDHLYAKVAINRIFSQQGGHQFLIDIVQGWETAAREARIRKPELGMRKLKDAAHLLALPAGTDTTLNFAKAMSVAWNNSDEKFVETMNELGVQTLNRRQVQAVLAKRPECWRA